MQTKRVEIDLAHPQPEAILQAASVLRSGGIIAVPTETLYGLGADPFEFQAVARIFHVKEREREKPLILLIKEPRVLKTLVSEVPKRAQILIDHFWPGPLTLVFEALTHIPPAVRGGGKTIALRISSSPVVMALLHHVDVMTAPSANLSGSPPLKTGREVLRCFAGKIDLILDGGPVRDFTPTTVVDVTTTPMKVIRVGKIPLSEIERVMENVRGGTLS